MTRFKVWVTRCAYCGHPVCARNAEALLEATADQDRWAHGQPEKH
jgi:Na+-translocating ferredoxin:NAD+ oxidoreductase RNF subunit RnfB